MHKIEKGVTATNQGDVNAQVTIIQVDNVFVDDNDPSLWIDYSLQQIRPQNQDEQLQKLRSQYVEYKPSNFKNHDLSEMNTDQDLSQEEQKFNCNSKLEDKNQQMPMIIKSMNHGRKQKHENYAKNDKNRSISYATSIYFGPQNDQDEVSEDIRKQQKLTQRETLCEYCTIM